MTAPATDHVGSYSGAIVAAGAVDADYTMTYVPGKLTVTPASLTITSDDQSMVYGAALPTLTASYSGFVNGDTAASLTTPPMLATTATASSPVSGNPYAITASGAVDADYAIGYVSGSLTVTPAPTSITVSASANSAVYGQAVNLTADVSASPTAPSEGKVAFYDNGNLLATEPVTSGVATLDNVIFPAGTDSITDSYSDTSGNFAASSTSVGPNSTLMSVAGNGTAGFSGDGGSATAAELAGPYGVGVDSSGDLFIADYSNERIREVSRGATVNVTPAPTSITVSASANSAVYGQAVNLTAHVSASPSTPSEGNVAFFDNGNLLATEPVKSGVATLDNVSLPAGAYVITASYSDANGNFASGSTAVGPNSIITTVAGGGTYGFIGDGGPPPRRNSTSPGESRSILPATCSSPTTSTIASAR